VLAQACSIEQPVSGPVSLTAEWKTIEPPEPLRVAGKLEQRLCLDVGTMRDVDFEKGVVVLGNGQRHTIAGEVVDSEQTTYPLKVVEQGKTVCLNALSGRRLIPTSPPIGRSSGSASEATRRCRLHRSCGILTTRTDGQHGDYQMLTVQALRPADIIVSTTNAGVSAVIRPGIGSSVSHSMIYVGGSNVIEAVERGVVRQPIAASLDHAVLAIALRRRNLTEKQRSDVVANAIRFMTRPYDTLGAAGSGTNTGRGGLLAGFGCSISLMLCAAGTAEVQNNAFHQWPGSHARSTSPLAPERSFPRLAVGSFSLRFPLGASPLPAAAAPVAWTSEAVCLRDPRALRSPLRSVLRRYRVLRLG
jgi:hypothetical protein